MATIGYCIGVKKLQLATIEGVEKATGPAGGVMSDFTYHPQSASSQSCNFYNTV